MAIVPGVTFPVDPTDSVWTDWLAKRKNTGKSLFRKDERGVMFHPTTNYLGSHPPYPMTPELDLGPNIFTTVGDKSDFTNTQSLVTGRHWNPAFARYIAPYSVLLTTLIDDTPVPYSAFYTSVMATYHWWCQIHTFYVQDFYTYQGNFVVNSPFGELKTYTESMSYIGWYSYPAGSPPEYTQIEVNGSMTYSGIWPIDRSAQPHTFWYNPDAPWERLFVDNNYAGSFSDKSIVSIFFHQQRSMDFTKVINGAGDRGDCFYPGEWPSTMMLYTPITISYGGRDFTVHAQAVTPSGGTVGTDYVVLGRTNAFESAITATVANMYDGLDPEVDNIRPLGITINIIR